MPFILTPNLKLRVDSNLTANSKYNLDRIDLLGASFQVDSTNALHIRSQESISLEPNSGDVGGTGSGGVINLGSPDHILDAVNIYANSVNFQTFSLADQAVGGDKRLNLEYKSDLNGPADTISDRTLFIDVDGANRNLILGANFSLSGANLSLTLSAPLAFILPPNYGGAGQTLTTDGTGVLSWSSAGAGTVREFADNWITADGTTKTVNHMLGSTDVEVTLIDLSDNSILWIDSIVVTNMDNITLTASEAPSSTWRVVVQA